MASDDRDAATDDEYNSENRETAGEDDSISVKPKTCVIHFEPGRTYTRTIRLLNKTARPQIVRITRPPEGEMFKFSDPTAFQESTVPPGGSWNLQFTFKSRANREFKSYLHLKNPTGRGNLRDVELRAVPKTHSGLPRAINFGNVDIGTSVSRKFRLDPESNPYQFRIFIPYGLEGLRVNPTCGQVLSCTPVDVTVVYTPQLCVTLCVDLVLYLSEGNQSPQIITLTAVTKPKANSTATIINDKKTTKKVINIPPIPRPLNRKKTEKEIVAFNRLTLNKMLAEKQTPPDNQYAWLSALGEPEQTYRESYTRCCDDFEAKANRFGNEHDEAGGFGVPSCDSEPSDEQLRCVAEQREAEWNVYEEKLRSRRNASCDDWSESSGSRERSIRSNCIISSLHDFDPNPDDNWSVRFQSYNRFMSTIKKVIIENRLKRRLAGFRALIDDHLIL